MGYEEEAPLPPDLPEDKLRPLLEKFTDGARKLGLYTEGIAINVDANPDGPPQHKLVAQFSIGDQAFTKRVQDPESDSIDHEFRKIEGQTLRDQWEEIRRKHLGEETEEETE